SGTWRLAALSFFTLPSALVGGVLAVFASSRVISLGSLVGLLTVLGIAARNGILLISHYQHLEKYEGETFGPRLVLRGSRDRLSPILMTRSPRDWHSYPWLFSATSPATRSSTRWRWSSSAAWSPRRCSTCSWSPPSTCVSVS